MNFIFDPSLVLYLPLYQLDGVSFMSKDANGHLCTVAGALWRPNGRNFDGVDDYINCGNPLALQIADDITIEAWIKPDELRDAAIVSRATSYSPPNIQYFLSLNSGGQVFFVITNGTDYFIATWPGFVAGNWYHTVGTYNSTSKQLNIYGNGIAGTPATLTGTKSVVSTNVYIGSTISAQWFKGLVGEIRIYNRALTPLEVQHNYLATKWRYR